MAEKLTPPKIVFFLTDAKIYPEGINAGGGESASIALARVLAAGGYEIIVCANLPDGDTEVDGISFWNFGEDYQIEAISDRLQAIGPFHCIGATFVHPFLLLRNHKECLSRIIINHSPSVYINGLGPQTVLNNIDLMICVSEAQKKLFLEHTKEETKLKVVRHGFDPGIFTYQGPEGRDFSHVIIVGRVEHWKGAHLMFDFFPVLKKAVPDAKMTFIGDYSQYPGLSGNVGKIERDNPGLRFLGALPQAEVAKHLRTAGLLLFPSIVFESAGLVIVDAQASGCPVLGYDTGGVSEYLFDKQCGALIPNQDHQAFYTTAINLLQNPLQLRQYSINCETIARKRTWEVMAKELKDILARFEIAPQYLRTIHFHNCTVDQLMMDHHTIGNSSSPSDFELQDSIRKNPLRPELHLWMGLRFELQESKVQALMSYEKAAECAKPDDWQPHFRLVMIYGDLQNFEKAAVHAKKVLQIDSNFPLKDKLEEIVSLSENRQDA